MNDAQVESSGPVFHVGIGHSWLGRFCHKSHRLHQVGFKGGLAILVSLMGMEVGESHVLRKATLGNKFLLQAEQQ